MTKKKKSILALIGSASEHSSNEKLVTLIAQATEDHFRWMILNDLKKLPPFDPYLASHHPPETIIDLHTKIDQADGILICTPEYIFSIPSGLKNVLEWCVATTVFSGKPTGLITASAEGQKGHAELQLILQTLMAEFKKETTLLIPGIKGKINEFGELTHDQTKQQLKLFIDAFTTFVLNEVNSQ